MKDFKFRSYRLTLIWALVLSLMLVQLPFSFAALSAEEVAAEEAAEAEAEPGTDEDETTPEAAEPEEGTEEETEEGTEDANEDEAQPDEDGMIRLVTDDQDPELTTVELAEAATPAVVAILTMTQIQPAWGSPQTAIGSGSGVILTPDGHIVTNNHVVAGATELRVRLAHGVEYEGEVLARDERTDLAVIKIDAHDLPTIQLADSNQVRVGERAVAIGNPLGELEGTVTQGIVSGLNRTVSTQTDYYSPVNVMEGVIQTDAAINAGNSGGALLNSRGKLIGINVAKPRSTGQTVVEGIGFAIPSNTVAEIVNQLLNQGYVSGRPYLGIQPQNVNQRMRYYYSMPAGVYVRNVIEGSAAEKAGLQVSDIITSVDGEEVASVNDLQQILMNYAAGDEIELEIWRAGIYHKINLTLDEQQPRPLDLGTDETQTPAERDDDFAPNFPLP